MKLYFSNRFKRDYKKLSPEIKKILQTKLKLMSENPRHPSLRIKKVKSEKDIFEVSINMNIRITWQYSKNKILLICVRPNDKALK